MTCWRLVPDANTLHHLYSDFVNVNELALSGLPRVSLVPLCTSTPFYLIFLILGLSRLPASPIFWCNWKLWIMGKTSNGLAEKCVDVLGWKHKPGWPGYEFTTNWAPLGLSIIHYRRFCVKLFNVMWVVKVEIR